MRTANIELPDKSWKKQGLEGSVDSLTACYRQGLENKIKCGRVKHIERLKNKPAQVPKIRMLRHLTSRIVGRSSKRHSFIEEVLFLETVDSTLSRYFKKRPSPPNISFLPKFLRSKAYGRVSAKDIVIGPVVAPVFEMKK